MVAALSVGVCVFSQKHQNSLGAGQQPFVFPTLSTGQACGGLTFLLRLRGTIALLANVPKKLAKAAHGQDFSRSNNTQVGQFAPLASPAPLR